MNAPSCWWKPSARGGGVWRRSGIPRGSRRGVGGSLGLEARRKKPAAARDLIRSGPQAFLLAAKGGEPADPEQLAEIARRDWLPALNRAPEVKEAFTALARRFADRYGDTSLQNAAQGARAVLDKLARAIARNADGEYDRALPLAREAAARIGRANRAASLHAWLEVSYARQRATPAECREIASSLRRDLAGTPYPCMTA